MEGQVIGFFDNRSDAEQACNELKASGFSGGEIDMFEAGRGRTEEGGLIDKIKEFFGAADENDRNIYAEAARRGEVAVAVDADNDEEVNRAADILQRHHAVDLDRQVEQWQSQGWQGVQHRSIQQPQATTPPPATTAPRTTEGEQVIPVTEEELRVGKRQIMRGGIRLHSRVTEKPVQEQVELREEHVSVERHPVDRTIRPGEQAFQEKTIEARETAEEAVVSKQAKVVEEVALRKDVEEKTETVKDTLRRTDVEVEQLGPEQEALFAENYATELSRNDQYSTYDWQTLEPHARRDFEQRYPGRKWDQFKDAIGRGYERMRRKI